MQLLLQTTLRAIGRLLQLVLFNQLNTDPSGRYESRQALPSKVCAMGSTSHCSAAPAPQRAIDCCCPQEGTRAAVLNATSVADHA